MSGARETTLNQMVSARWLLRQEFPPIRYVVPSMIPEGMTLLVAAPKVGKSWLVLGLGIALAEGGDAFGGIPVGEPRPVLYLALEDGQRRLAGRLRSLDARLSTDNLQFITDLPAKSTVLEIIREFLAENIDAAPVVIIDVLAKVMPPAAPGESSYDRDYKVGGALKAAIDTVPGSSLIVVHHTRKQSAEDFTDTVSGTNGLAGSADTIAVLRRDRLGKTATMAVTSREVAEAEYALTIEDNGAWRLDGADLAAAARHAREQHATAGVGDRMAEIVEIVTRSEAGITPRQIKDLLPGVAGIDEYLRRAVAAERIGKLSHGLYGPVICVRSVSTDLQTHTSHTSHTLRDVA